MDEFDYGEVCPVSKAASVLCERWTLQIIREMLMGATRFSEFQRYLPKLSPALLNSRLKMLEDNGIILRRKVSGKTGFEYQLTAAGKGLAPLLREFGRWGMQWAFTPIEDDELNGSVIVRDFASALNTDLFPAGDSTLQFNVRENDSVEKKYVLVRNGSAQSCDENIGHEVDVYITGELKTFYKIWFGEISVSSAKKDEKLTIVGPSHYTRNISQWLRTSQFAPYNRNAESETNEVEPS